MIKYIALALSIVAFACISPENIDPSSKELTLEQKQQNLRILISGYEEGPDPSRLNQLDLDVVEELIAIASNPDEKRFYRARAFDALGYYQADSRVFPFFDAQLSQPNTLGTFILPSAIRSTTFAFGTDRPEEVAQLVAPTLSHVSSAVRESAVRALAETPTPLAKTALENAVDVETDSSVKAAIQTALAR